MKQSTLFEISEHIVEHHTLYPTKQGHALVLFVDGASRNNPGHSGVGIYLLKDGTPVCQQGFYVGIKTNNQAEYLALLVGLFFMSDYYQDGDHVRIVADSQLMVMQIMNKYKVTNSALRPLHALAQRMVRMYNARIEHVLRSANKQADTMANKGLDNRIPLPDAFIELLQSHGIIITISMV